MRRLLLTTVLFAVAALLPPVLSGAAAERGADVGDVAAEIRVSKWIGGDGRTQLGDFRGQVVLLQFWQSH